MEKRVADIIEETAKRDHGSILAGLEWQGAFSKNAPRDFVGVRGIGLDITTNTRWQINKHFGRTLDDGTQAIHAVITYEPIPTDYASRFNRHFGF